ncbi:hypothetical protein KPH14_000782 [Odynerus spinipes]|uniref:Ty3 transposon capsid-like protein domain-containing protein n=1 Tax=Odynerus spinipes TaxID=1348599 RepID=A0AAD9RF20_9HYME|nr:hypothetical protein KPH14_000782 [Odynerus spinipes]
MGIDTRAKTKRQTSVTLASGEASTVHQTRMIRSPTDKRSHDSLSTSTTETATTEMDITTTLQSILKRLKGIEEQQKKYEARLLTIEEDTMKRCDEQIGAESEQIHQILTEVRQEIRGDIRVIKEQIEQLGEGNNLQGGETRRQRIASGQNLYGNNRQASVYESQQLPLSQENLQGRQEYTPRSKFAKPQLLVFEAKSNERPLKFLRQLEKFIGFARIADDEFLLIIGQALKGAAAEWWDVVSEQVGTWEEFSKLFIARFWNASIQKRIRGMLDTGYYKEHSGQTRVTYAMKLIGDARDLRPQKTDEEIVQMLSKHYNQAIDEAGLDETLVKFLEVSDTQAGEIECIIPSHATRVGRRFFPLYTTPPGVLVASDSGDLRHVTVADSKC